MEPREALPGVLAPAYEGGSIANLLPAMLRALGVPAQGTLPPLTLPAELAEGVERIALLTLDGWGWNQLQRGMEGGWAKLAAHAELMRITSVAPSTTTAAIASLNTGLAPSQHGLLGYHLWLQEFGCVANMVAFAPAAGGRGLDAQVRPEDFFTAPTAAQLLGQAGAHHLNVTRREFLGSPLTRMVYKGGEAVGTTTLGELLVEMRGALGAMPGSAGVVQGYWPSIDTVAHARGPGSAHHAAELAMLGDALARELLDKAHDPKALLLITADHGLATIPPERVLRVREHAELRDALLLPNWGDSRWGFLQSREGQREALREAMQERLGPGGHVLDMGEVQRLGLLGPLPWCAEARGRVGDLVALPAPGHGMTWPFSWNQPGRPPKEELLGRHGGCTPDEMLVPLMALRLG
ncbi:MAG: alkaline phosphatase family protein [Halobacteriales archaeon]|nr:alkaline phosphatase family protein [Halobacteriales archaeon]